NAGEIYGGPDALIPHLWRDGIRAAKGTWVATTTAHCIPASDWVARLKGHVDDPAAAIGGVLANEAAATSLTWAIYPLCYPAFGFFGQRRAHGRQFGRARAATWSRVRLLAMLLAAPLLPLAFLRKIVRAARRHPVCSPHVLPALGWLLVFVSAWGMGEAM